MKTHSADGRADATRQQILRAASYQFARRPYHDVGLDDILNEAALTKGAMYFHFRSKQALAVAIIERQTTDVGRGPRGGVLRGEVVVSRYHSLIRSRFRRRFPCL